MAYKGAFPPRSCHIWANATQPPRVLPSAYPRYSREEAEEYRIDTGILASHSGLRIGLLSSSAAIVIARILRTTSILTTFGIVVLCSLDNMYCPPQIVRVPGRPTGGLVPRPTRSRCRCSTLTSNKYTLLNCAVVVTQTWFGSALHEVRGGMLRDINLAVSAGTSGEIVRAPVSPMQPISTPTDGCVYN